ncbi:uncharacterized protein FOMMEDRAFT_143305 [Fomitiporia mediterranea MF3/22]|uniref:uncharacterized protein n=1 Tax=Fomitiporia mediterranea (strain MF3/22) TaxID=694068 RepID=UPI00044080C6|nr:uncharacterized protein FOMMEDRAFT_143305 [Fomitiporia mediterranea MF3/22]EJC98209.1 hypothetical protein FOMMEDRAFT_143305 [Fomitiporia mediterranea MF3/22]
MVFRLPTPFDAIVPSPPSSTRRVRHTRPWRGVFILHGINLFQSPDGQQRLLVASAETEGDKSSRTDLWPKQFEVHIAQPACRIADVQAWVTRNDIPLCMFMPDRHASDGTSAGMSVTTNEAHFRALSRVLVENQLLCIAPWPAPGFPETRTGAGILIFPSAASMGLLIGAVFLNTPFPDFMGLFSGGAGGGPSANAVPSGLPFAAPTSLDYTFAASPYGAPITDPNTGAGPNAPGSGPGAGPGPQQQGQVHYRGGSPTYYTAQPSFAMAPGGANAYYSTKPQMDGFANANDGSLRAALAAAPFDWSMFDDTTDGSGSTSPGSTRTW